MVLAGVALALGCQDAPVGFDTAPFSPWSTPAVAIDIEAALASAFRAGADSASIPFNAGLSPTGPWAVEDMP